MTKQAIAVAALAATGLLAGCRQDMQDQPKFFPQRGTTFAGMDGRSVRPQVEGTVARNQLHEDAYFYTGMVNGKEGDGMPFPATLTVLERGQERYNIYCTPCHSRVGNGDGMVVQRGYHVAGDFHTARLEQAPLGHFFNVMSNGYGAMPDYSAQLTPQDRWAVAAYIRALQLSQNAKPGDVPAGVTPEPLSKIATEEGLPANFEDEWKLPATAVESTTMPVAATPVAPQATTPSTKSTNGPAATPQAKAGPAKPSAADVAAGHQLYMKNCQSCHQAARTGLPTAIPSLVGVVGKIGAGKVEQTISNGVPTGNISMPAFGKRLSPEDISHLVEFLANPQAGEQSGD